MRPSSRVNVSQRRFTMIELMIVIVILILLAGVVLRFSTASGHAAADAETKTMVDRFRILNETYKAKYGHYLPQSTNVAASNNIVVPRETGSGKAVEEDFFGNAYEYFKERATTNDGTTYYLSDAYGNRFYYAYPGVVNREGYDFISYGADGVNDNGKGDDISNFTAN